MYFKAFTKHYRKVYVLLSFSLFFNCDLFGQRVRSIADFDKGWHFRLGDDSTARLPGFNDAGWRFLDLPNDWSIEGKFSKDNPAGPDGAGLPGGIGWYRKSFRMPESSRDKLVFIDFDGVYQKSTVWLNGHKLGFRPNGYISFRYELTPYLNFGGENTIAVKVDNSAQPNSRWYSGSGIYRNVWLITTNKIAIDHWGVFITTPQVSEASATLAIETRLKTTGPGLLLKTTLYDDKGLLVKSVVSPLTDSVSKQSIIVARPQLWSVSRPYLYRVVSRVLRGNRVLDDYTTPLGIRYFNFDTAKGFSLNGRHLKILGVCDHHDLGCLGAAVNTRALERQLELLKGMGCNAIRTSHNPPAPELLALADKMGFIIMDEAFDCWELKKTTYDYHLYFDEWHRQDLRDQVMRDRNHPSVFIWSIGNEIFEQGSKTALKIAPELTAIIHEADTTRPITSGTNQHNWDDYIIKSGALDLIGYNYEQNVYPDFPKTFPGKKFIATETTSSFQRRGNYLMPSDTIHHWPADWDNPEKSTSAYDNFSMPNGSTHEAVWKIIKKYDFLSGMFIWTGFDYLGEPGLHWPSRSSYFGIFDLAGFPKDIYYMYLSEWTDKPVLYIYPHWNWPPGKIIDIWAYYNHADEVELYLNGKSLGTKKKTGDDLHVKWAVPFEPGTLRAVSRKNGRVVLTTEIHTAGQPAKIELLADRKHIKADGKDLSFITIRILDKDGNVVPDADNRVDFNIKGNAFLAGADNGDQTDLEPFKTNNRKAFHGLALAILQTEERPGKITFTATGDGLQSASILIDAK